MKHMVSLPTLLPPPFSSHFSSSLSLSLSTYMFRDYKLLPDKVEVQNCPSIFKKRKRKKILFPYYIQGELYYKQGNHQHLREMVNVFPSLSELLEFKS